MHKLVANALLGAVLVASGAAANAASIDVNLAGFQSTADFSLTGDGNTVRTFNIGAGSLVTGFSYLNLSFATAGESWLGEFVLSVNNATGSEFLDWSPSTATGGGVFGPASGSWNGATGQPGPYDEGAAFTVADGVILVTTYESFDDPGVDATVSAGTLRIFYTAAVPEPATYALFGLGLLGIGAAARRPRRD